MIGQPETHPRAGCRGVPLLVVGGETPALGRVDIQYFGGFSALKRHLLRWVAKLKYSPMDSIGSYFRLASVIL